MTMEESLAAQNQRIAENIREYGWHCLHIFPVRDGQDKFSYSVGFAESYGAPEVLIFGLEREKAHALLNECAWLLKNGHTILPGIEDANVLAGDYKVVFRSIRSECFGEYLGTAMRYYQDKPFDAVVMFLPDRAHRFPWQPGYDDIAADESLTIVWEMIEEDAQQPIPAAWRQTFRDVVDAFVAGDYRLDRGVPGVESIAPDAATRIRETLVDYGATLTALPEETWETSVCIRADGHWEALVDLWTREEGRSDLVLHARVFDDGRGFLVKVQLVYVP